LPIGLPPSGQLSAAEVYVPAGWFWAGGDDEATDAIARRRLWVDAFTIARFPVTNREYIAFLDDFDAIDRSCAETFIEFAETALCNALRFRELEQRSLKETATGVCSFEYFRKYWSFTSRNLMFRLKMRSLNLAWASVVSTDSWVYFVFSLSSKM